MRNLRWRTLVTIIFFLCTIVIPIVQPIAQSPINTCANGGFHYAQISPTVYRGRTAVITLYNVGLPASYCSLARETSVTYQVWFATGGIQYPVTVAGQGDAFVAVNVPTTFQPGNSYAIIVRRVSTVSCSGIPPYTTQRTLTFCGAPTTVQDPPPYNPVEVRSSASFAAPVAKNSLASIFGVGMSATTASAQTIPLPTVMGNVKVEVEMLNSHQLFNAGLQYISPTQFNVLVPETVNDYGDAIFRVIDTTLPVSNVNRIKGSGIVRIDGVAPGIFTAKGDGTGVPNATALRVRADGTYVYENIFRVDPATNAYVPIPIDLGPASEQVYLVLWGTGVRHTTKPNDVNPPNPNLGLRCSIGTVDSFIAWYGASTSYVGVDQINVLIPRSLIGRGEVDLRLTATLPDNRNTKDFISNTVKVNIK